eukprot:gene3921-4896_t
MGAPGDLPPSAIIDRPVENYLETVRFVKYHTQDCIPGHFRLVLATEKDSWSRAIRIVNNASELSGTSEGGWKEVKAAGNDSAFPFYPPSPSNLVWSEQFRYDAAWINMHNYQNLQLECWKDKGFPFFWTCLGGKKIKFPAETNDYAGCTLVCFWLDDNTRVGVNALLSTLPYPAPAQLLQTKNL